MKQTDSQRILGERGKINTGAESGRFQLTCLFACIEMCKLHVKLQDIHVSIHDEKNVSRVKCKYGEQFFHHSSTLTIDIR